MIPIKFRKILCKINLHHYKPFTRYGEVNWLIMTVNGKRCTICNKEKIDSCI